MINFERVGVQIQMESATLTQAKKAFEWSCTCCCNRGMRIDCDACAIAFAHENVKQMFEDRAKAKHKARVATT